MRMSRGTLWACLLALMLCLSACGGDDNNNNNNQPAPDAGQDEDTTEPEDTGDPEDVDEPEDTDEPDEDADEPYVVGDPPPHVREERAAAEGQLQAGIGLGYLDGPVGISMAGYGARSGPKSNWGGVLKSSMGFYGHMSIKAMVMEVDGERVALVKLPTMSSEHSFTDGIAARLQEKYGIDMKGRVLTGATHSHHTHARYWRLPDGLGVIGIDTPDEEVIALLIEAFTEAIKDGIDKLAPAQWGFAYQDDWDPDDRIYRDRRDINDPLYPKDPRLSLLAVQRPDGTPMATIINFGMHGTAFGGGNSLLTEDSAGGLELKFEEYFYAKEGQPIAGMFIQSGGGDAAPAGGHQGHPTPARIEMLGQEAAPKIYNLYKTIEFKDTMSLSVRSRRVDLRYDWMGYKDSDEFKNADGEPYYWGAFQCANGEDGGSSEGQPKQCLSLEFLLNSFGAPLPNSEVHQAYLTVARLDDLFLVTLPGEPAYSVIKYLRDSVAERNTEDKPLDVMAWGYSQDHLLYLTHPDDWYLGDYESSSSPWGPFFGRYIVDRQMQVVDDMLEGFNGPIFHEESGVIELERQEWEPRAFERSLEIGTVQEATTATYKRTENVRLGFSGGDPTVGSPYVVLQAQSGTEGFEDVPSPSGIPGRSYDNTRYHMLTTFRPEPPMSKEILPERNHMWVINWEIPADFPAGTYRLRATGPYWDGTAEQTYEILSEPFTIEQSDSAQLALSREGDTLRANLTVPAVPYMEEEGRGWAWPEQGWRLMDDSVRVDAPQNVRAGIVMDFLVNGESSGITANAEFDAEAGAFVVDMTQVTLPADAAITVRAHLQADRTPSYTQPVPLP